jgi:phage terminase large subunit-like protein
MDDAGNIKPTKKHSHDTGRIDGAVALIMALGIASTVSHGEENPYEIMVI